MLQENPFKKLQRINLQQYIRLEKFCDYLYSYSLYRKNHFSVKEEQLTNEPSPSIYKYIFSNGMCQAHPTIINCIPVECIEDETKEKIPKTKPFPVDVARAFFSKTTRKALEVLIVR